MAKHKNKLFIIRKYIMASSAIEAIRKERKLPVDDVYVDDEWKKEASNNLASAIGFEINNNEE